MLGFDEAMVALMIALYMAQDSFGTATNVTGDGALAIIVDKFTKDKATCFRFSVNISLIEKIEKSSLMIST